MNTKENKIVNEFLQNNDYKNYKIEFSTESIVSVRVYFVTAFSAFDYKNSLIDYNENIINDIGLANISCSANIVNLTLQKKG